MRSSLRAHAESLRTGAAVACFALAGGLGALARAEHARATSVPAPPSEIRVAGERLPDATAGDAATEDTTSAASTAAAIAAAWAREPLEIRFGAEAMRTTRGEAGGRVDVEALAALIERAHAPGSTLRHHHAATRGTAPLDLPLRVTLDATALLPALLDRKDHLDVRPIDARMRPRSGEIVPEREGLTLDVHGTLDAVTDALREGRASVEARVVREPPRRAARDLAGVSTEALLGFFETRYSTLPESADRTYNLHVAADRVDGWVVLPGETFDFNDTVGPRSEANGFRPAPQIAGGELVDGVGGGTCQIAGTLHAAVFFAGLDVVERHPHSRPSSYLWMGLDATVAYPDIDFRFRNDLDFPVVLGLTLEGGVARAEIRGARADRLVTFTRRTDEVTPFELREERDPELPVGVRVLRQRGVPGFRTTWFRTLRDPRANQAVRERGEDTYPPTTEIWRVGAGGPAPAGYVPPPGDGHPPYASDRYLSASEGVGVEGLTVSRR